MLYSDSPARIASPGTYSFSTDIAAAYTVGRDFVHDAMVSVFRRTDAVSVDIETYGLGLDSRRIKSVAFADDLHSVVFDPRDPYQAEMVRATFAHARSLAVFKSTFDVPSLYLNGLMTLADVRKVVDPLLYARLATPGIRAPKTLEALSDRYLNTGSGGELARAFKALGLTRKAGFWKFDLDRPVYLQGAASDPLITQRILPLVIQHAYDTLTTGHPFTKHGVHGEEAWALVHREQRINRIFLARSCRGMRVDFEYLDRYMADNALELAEADEALHAAGLHRTKAGGFSAQELAKLLDERGEIAPDHPRTGKTGQIQMDKKAMALLGSPLARSFARRAEIEHIRKDYLQKTVELAINGKVHPEVNILAAVTGRASYGAPPTHQFSGPARGILLFDEGDDGTSIDLAQGEPITIANMAQDFQTVEAYEAGVSLYVQLGTASGLLPAGTTKAMCDGPGAIPALNKIYKMLKIVVLAQTYGEGLAKLSADLGLSPGPYEPIDSREAGWRGMKPGTIVPRFAAARALRDKVESGWPKTSRFVQTLKNVAKDHRMIITVSGRIIPIPVGKFGVEAHKGVNYPCQGGQYDLIADALIRCEDAGLADAIYLTQHDEFVVSTSAAHDIRKILTVPAERLKFWAGGRQPVLRTDMKHLGERWADA
jgi:DNA polymerase-1